MGASEEPGPLGPLGVVRGGTHPQSRGSIRTSLARLSLWRREVVAVCTWPPHAPPVFLSPESSGPMCWSPKGLMYSVGTPGIGLLEGRPTGASLGPTVCRDGPPRETWALLAARRLSHMAELGGGLPLTQTRGHPPHPRGQPLTACGTRPQGPCPPRTPQLKAQMEAKPYHPRMGALV